MRSQPRFGSSLQATDRCEPVHLLVALNVPDKARNLARPLLELVAVWLGGVWWAAGGYLVAGPRLGVESVGVRLAGLLTASMAGQLFLHHSRQSCRSRGGRRSRGGPSIKR